MPLLQRKLPRLSNFDYSQNGCYFITVCTHNKTHLFGKVVECSIQLNRCGQIAQVELTAIPSHYSDVSIDHFVVMPNHVHILLTIDQRPERASPVPSNNGSETPGIPASAERASPDPTEPSIIETERASPFPTVSSIIGSYKSGVTNIIHQHFPEITVWQKSFYDHIIRDEMDYSTICEYIENNPFIWEQDSLYLRT